MTLFFTEYTTFVVILLPFPSPSTYYMPFLIFKCAPESSIYKTPSPIPAMNQQGKTEIKEMMDKAEISLILDTYDDIFSSFDPRPYGERALSDDFLKEARNAARGKRNGIELHFLVPEPSRNTKYEDLIRFRLRDHFKKHYKHLREELKKQRKRAAAIVVVGLAIGLVDALLLTFGELSTLLQNVVEITLTPASWYAIWNGLDWLLVRPSEEASEESFNKKMIDAKITFTPY